MAPWACRWLAETSSGNAQAARQRLGSRGTGSVALDGAAHGRWGCEGQSSGGQGDSPPGSLDRLVYSRSPSAETRLTFESDGGD